MLLFVHVGGLFLLFLNFNKNYLLVESRWSTTTRKPTTATTTMPAPCYMPHECSWLERNQLELTKTLLCDRLSAKFDANEFVKNSARICLPKFSENFVELEVFFNKHTDTSRVILDNSFEMLNLTEILMSSYRIFNRFAGPTLNFSNLRGFRTSLALSIAYTSRLVFRNSEFEFFTSKDGRDVRLRSCEEYMKSIESADRIQSTFIVNEYKNENSIDIFFENPVFSTPVCPLVFRNAQFTKLIFSGLVNSYYKTNIIKFLRFPNKTTFNTSIGHLAVQTSFGLILDHELVHPALFANTTMFTFDGVIHAIHGDFFPAFSSLKEIVFNPKYFRTFVLDKGIEWMRTINEHLRVNLTNQKSVKSDINRMKIISFRFFFIFQL